MYDTLELERDGAIAHVWLNRPEKLNAINSTMLKEIVQVCDALQQMPDVSVVVWGGRGRAFSAGADFTAPPGGTGAQAATNARAQRYAGQIGRRATEAIESLEATTIARVHGWAVGGGLVLALACDFRIAAASTTFCIPEVDLGIPLMWGAVPRLIQCAGPTKAREWILLCDRFPAAEAQQHGLLNAVVPDDDLDGTVREWAQRLAAKDELARHVTKTQFRAYGRRALLGDLTECDADAILMGGRMRRPAGGDAGDGEGP